ncbi:MAG: Ig domain-containing protein [Verrucomicrobiota bacterium]
MLKYLLSRVATLCLGCSALSSLAADFTIDQIPGHVVPSTRGTLTTTHFGWDNFEDPAPGTFLNDSTPDIGTTSVGVKFETTNGQLHRAPSTGNFYSGSDTVTALIAEKVTVATNGTVGSSGFTTILVQLSAASGNFISRWTFGPISGVNPTVIHGVNSAKQGQVWVKWVIPGNAASYEFTIGGVAHAMFGNAHMSFNKIEVDTYYGAEAQPDTVIATTPALASIMDQVGAIAAPSTRGKLNTTHFGWDNFEDPAPGTFLNDSTPDIGTTTTGVKFETTNGQLHRAPSTGNFYSGSDMATAVIEEKVTVATNGTVGSTGFTTIIAQLVAGSGNFISQWTFGNINGVSPTVVHGVNSAAKGQVWVKWVVPGNAVSYEFTIGSVAHAMFGGAHMSFDKIEIDTIHSSAAQGDTMKAKTVEVTTLTLADATKGISYNAELTAAGGQSPYTWTLKGATQLPAGLILSPAGVISGTPTALGLHQFTVVAESANAFKGELNLSLNVLPGLVNHFTLKGESGPVVPSTRGAFTSTHFGWDNFEDPAPGTFLNDSTPDIGTTTTGVKFETTNGQLHRAPSTGNFYSGSDTATAVIAEKVTVATKGTVGSTGFTTIIAQLVSSSGNFISTWSFGDIAGVTPQVIQSVNAAGKGQVWVRWVIPGNAASYEFTIGSAAHAMFGGAHMAFDKIEIDTFWGEEPQGDTMILQEPAALASIMDQATGIVAPSSRGSAGTTFFGWEAFNNPGPAAIINDNTPDIGTYVGSLARFRTTNSQIHQFAGNANLYFLSGTLAEEVTVPTAGIVGEGGFTTIFLQIASATSGMGGGSFAGPITTTINDVAPTAVVQAGSATSAQYWAKWEIPGNQPTYTIVISGPENQAHFSFDKVVVDTKFSPYAYVADTMKPKTVEITTETLADAVKNTLYSPQLVATGGTTPHTWSLKPALGTNSVEIPLPAGLTISSSGQLSWTPATLGDVRFTAVAESANGFKNERTYELTVVPALTITTTTLPTPVVGVDYTVTLTSSGGPDPISWEVADGDALPAGLTLSAAGVISGKPTAAGSVTFTVVVRDGDTSEFSKDFTLNVSGSFLAPVVNAVVFGSKVVGEEFSHTVTAQNYPSKFTVTGLPKGMKVVVANGTAVLSGRASLAGVYLVQIRASNTGGNSPIVTAPLVIKALPVAQVGTFTGLISRDATANSGLGSLFTLTTTSTGAYTLQVKAGAVSKSAKGFLNGSAPQVQISINGADLALSLNAQTHLVTGTHGAATASGWRLVWDKKFNPPSSLEGYYSTALELSDEEDLEDVTLPQGIGYTTFTVAPAGTVKLTGKSADGQTITASTNLGPNGELAIYAPVYANKGTLLGQWAVEEDEEGLFIGNKVTGELTWSKPVTTGRTYPAAFGPVDLAVEGGYLGATATGVVMGLPEMEATIGMSFEGAGIESSATVANVTGAKWTEGYAVDFAGATNAGKVTLKVSKASGSLSGTFTLADTEPVKLDRKGVKFTGQVVRLSDGTVKAVGHYLLAQKPANATEKPTATPILSGAFLLTQPSLAD